MYSFSCFFLLLCFRSSSKIFESCQDEFLYSWVEPVLSRGYTPDYDQTAPKEMFVV